MKPKSFIILVNISIAIAIIAFMIQGKIVVVQLPIIVVVSLIIINGAAIIGLRLGRRRHR